MRTRAYKLSIRIPLLLLVPLRQAEQRTTFVKVALFFRALAVSHLPQEEILVGLRIFYNMFYIRQTN